MNTLAVHEYRTGSPGSPTLVLLHGFPVDHRMWDDVTEHLTGDVTVVAPDLPLLGSSPDVEAVTQDGSPSLEAGADAVAAFMALLAPGPVVLAGLSMGGYVALALLERHPGLVHGLALLDTKATADDDGARSNRLRVAAEVESLGHAGPVLGMARATLGATSRERRPELVGTLHGWISGQSAAGIAWSQRAMAARPDRTAALAGFAGPTVVLVGQEDEITPPAGAEQMASALPGARLVVVPAAGHMSPVEQPEAVARALDELVRTVRDRAAPGRGRP